MISINKILAAVDFSEHTPVVLSYAAELSRLFSAEVLCCHVTAKASALFLSGYLEWQDRNEARAGELLALSRDALSGLRQVAGASGEGDTRSDRMIAARRIAAGRRLFAECLDAVATGSVTGPDEAFSCVDRARADLARR